MGFFDARRVRIADAVSYCIAKIVGGVASGFALALSLSLSLSLAMLHVICVA